MKDKAPIIVLGCAAALFVTMALAVTWIIVAAARRHAESPSAETTPSKSRSPSGPAARAARESEPTSDPLGRKFQKIEVADRRHVDLTEILPQAQALARRVVPGAQFTDLHASQLRGGTVDLDGLGQTKPVFTFEYSGYDKTKPPGQDKVDARIWVHVEADRLTGWNIGGHIISRDGALETPRCSSKKAWKAAVESGVPSNAVATFHYFNNKTFSPEAPFVWSIRVEGHDEYRREIHGHTCALVKRWDQPTPGGGSGATGKKRRKR